ncbi:MAG: helix-turn-helix domain-containing protein [Lysobacter sp.]|nr:helix-turn-helix domain-containing protein [Lysobacter sp.]
MNSMSSRIRRARTLATMTQSELAHRVGVNRSAVTQWERSGGTTPSVDHLARIACETAVCFEWLATGRGASQPESGAFETALMVQDFARDEWESRVLSGMRRLSGRKKEVATLIVELLSG